MHINREMKISIKIVTHDDDDDGSSGGGLRAVYVDGWPTDEVCEGDSGGIEKGWKKRMVEKRGRLYVLTVIRQPQLMKPHCRESDLVESSAGSHF